MNGLSWYVYMLKIIPKSLIGYLFFYANYGLVS